MLDRIVAQIALALFAWLEKRMSRGHVAVDADRDRASLSRAATRIREWMHKQDRVRTGGLPDESRGTERSTDEGLPPDKR